MKFPVLQDRSSLRGIAQNTVLQQNMARTKRYTVSLTPSQVSANSTGTETVTDAVCTSGDDVTVQGPTQPAGITLMAQVTDTDTVLITFANSTGGAVTPTSGDYEIRIFRK